MGSTFLDVYWAVGPILAPLFVVAVAIIFHLRKMAWTDIAVVLVLGLVTAYFFPVVPIVAGGAYLIFVLVRSLRHRRRSPAEAE